MSKESVRVFIRMRANEPAEEIDEQDFALVDETAVEFGREKKKLSFDYVLSSACEQTAMYAKVGQDVIKQFMNGFNGTIFAYGQSGSGKTYTMLGPEDVVEELKKTVTDVPQKVQALYGIIPRAVDDIFSLIAAEKAKNANSVFEMQAYYLEIYMEQLNDLLTEERNLKMRLRQNGSIQILNCAGRPVAKKEDIYEILREGQLRRAVAETG